MMSEVLRVQVEAAAKAAGLVVVSAEPGEKYSGGATAKFHLAPAGGLASDPRKTQLLELSEGFEFGRQDLNDGVRAYLAESARRLKNPRPDCYFTLHGLPLSFSQFGWPFHESTSGADTSLVHGEVHLEDGVDHALHAKVAVSKTMDQGQLELVKSGNRQPVPLTTRYYSVKQKKFIFNDTSEEQRKSFLAGKVYWLSGVLGGGEPVWLLDPRDVQYLDATVDELRGTAEALAAEGLLRPAADPEYAAPTAKLMERRDAYLEQLARTLQSIKPAFNEEMRGGLTNM
jgi:hypothetical protein